MYKRQYYDFARKDPFTEEDLRKIEKRMIEIVERDEPTHREVWKRDKAIEHFKKAGEIYKAEIIKDIPKEEEVSVYFHGKWHDLCRGPHLPTTKHIGKSFKLMKVAGAYWRGDENNEMLTRIYGTAWRTDKELRTYLNMLKEAEKRGAKVDESAFRYPGPKPNTKETGILMICEAVEAAVRSIKEPDIFLSLIHI